MSESSVFRRKWDEVVSSHLGDENMVFVSWINGELEQIEHYGFYVRVRCSCADGHEWIRDTIRRHMSLDVLSNNVDLNDVIRSFPSAQQSMLAAYCPICKQMCEDVTERHTLAEQPQSLFVIKLIDYAVGF
jgi:hypothetical protein